MTSPAPERGRRKRTGPGRSPAAGRARSEAAPSALLQAAAAQFLRSRHGAPSPPIPRSARAAPPTRSPARSRRRSPSRREVPVVGGQVEPKPGDRAGEPGRRSVRAHDPLLEQDDVAQSLSATRVFGATSTLSPSTRTPVRTDRPRLPPARVRAAPAVALTLTRSTSISLPKSDTAPRRRVRCGRRLPRARRHRHELPALAASARYFIS